MAQFGLDINGVEEVDGALYAPAWWYRVGSIAFKVFRSGFLVKIAPRKTAAMAEFYPAYLHYGVKRGRRLGKLAPGTGKGKSNRRAAGARAAIAERAAGEWRIKPRDNYMADALQDSSSDVKGILSAAFASALR
ncbi:hypothetical protein [Pseudomonas protegens]|uniref:hypothetical protein n=1 Tax=Pseudomonas protegens TaxID=380021 RepID=UPI0019675568|nr:hypothetical protein [Pseudomonas protegens]